MLIDASDYTYNATNIATDAVTIEGRIIPTEDINGQPHPLRRENFAYLSEAISERRQASTWIVPGYRSPVIKTHPAGIASLIISLYSQNFRFMDEDDSSYPARASSLSEYSASDAYHDKLLDSSDCNIPGSVPDGLSADYLRHLFYAVNRLRYGWQSFSPTVGTFGGEVKFSATNKEGRGVFTQMCDQNEMQSLGSANGNSVEVSWQIGTTSGKMRLQGSSLYSFQDWDFSTYPSFVTQEGNYSGRLFFGLSAMPDFTSPRLFLKFQVVGADGSRKYVWKPVQAQTATYADGFAYLFVTWVDLNFFRSLVSLCFPDASFTLSGSSTRSYGVSLIDEAVLAEFPYKSILPSAWTWTPN